MSVQSFCKEINSANYGKKDREWFPKWIRRYAASCGVKKPDANQTLPVSTDQVIQFSKSLLKSSTPAWQRLQAVRAVEAYRDLVLKSSTPSLKEIRFALNRLAAQEKDASFKDATWARDDKIRILNAPDVVGKIDTRAPVVIQRMQKELRLQGKELATERAYVGWIKQFIAFVGSVHLEDFSEPEIKEFLSSLAVERNHAPSTQKQAKSSLLFMYQDVFDRIKVSSTELVL
jgi:hypothetical protein